VDLSRRNKSFQTIFLDNPLQKRLNNGMEKDVDAGSMKTFKGHPLHVADPH
jgi:hypothetical protein